MKKGYDIVEIKLITTEIENAIKDELKKLLQNEIEELEVDTFYPRKIIDYLEELGVSDSFDDFDCNGWDYDYWVNFKHNNNKYCISGSGYYGKLTVSIDD